jgi:hypothetical protein
MSKLLLQKITQMSIMLLLFGRPKLAYNVFGLSVEGDVDAFHCQPTTKI